MRILLAALALVVAVPIGAAGDEISDMYVNKARAFVAANPVIDVRGATPKTLVILWTRVDGIKNLVQLYVSGELPFDMRPGVHKRLHQHRLQLMQFVRHADPFVVGLSSLLATHAHTAQSRLRGDTDGGVYGAVADLARSPGGVLAKHIASKFAPGEDLIPPPPKITGWGKPN